MGDKDEIDARDRLLGGKEVAGPAKREGVAAVIRRHDREEVVVGLAWVVGP